MLDTVIIGGGLCGLALADNLNQQGYEFALYEARERLGGRILSVPCATSGMNVDLGPTWFWPDTQPRITKTMSDLGLVSFPQHDSDTVLHLTDHDKEPDKLTMPNVHGGAMRLEGGMAALVNELASRLPPAAIHPGQELISVHDKNDHIELLFRSGDVTTIVHARRIVLAIPPRLLEERVSFTPPLDEATRKAMRATHTWMADQAKVVVGYSQPFWREANESGNAFVSHDHMVLSEVFDACDSTATHAALGGFFSLPPQYRATVNPEMMPMLISSQMVQIFGQKAGTGEQHVQDWATEPYTSSTLDLTPPGGHPEYGNPVLRRPLWNFKLFLGSAETAGYGGGYMEGALEAAARIYRSLATDEQGASDNPLPASDNEDCLTRFREQVSLYRSTAFERYRLHLHRYLSAQVKEQLTQRALLDTVEQVYSEALDHLGDLPFNTASVAIQRGRSDLTPDVLESFDGFNMSLLEEVVEFNKGSCAISNFPDEHAPAQDYVETISRDLAAAFREFAINVNHVLIGKGQPG